MSATKSRLKSLALTVAATSLLAGCAGTASLEGRREIAQRLAAPVWMVERQIDASPFTLTAYERVHTHGGVANVYIEGDGLAWLSRSRLSLNPTPKNPVALNLAARDKAENVIYLARPCQYSGLNTADKPCDSAYWSNKRFAPEVIAAMNAALDDMKARYNLSGFNLIGFSGGAAVSNLLVGQRSDILSIRSVAGNLDHKAHSEYHRVSYLEGSLDTLRYKEKLANTPQIHFIGGQDNIVPSAIYHSYAQKIGKSSCIQHEFIQEAAHDTGWVDLWPSLLARRPSCAK